MRSDCLEHCRPHFSILSTKQIEELHFATLQVLERTGVTFQSQRAINLLGDAGADVSNPDRVKIPSYLVEQAIRTAPKNITLFSRDGEPAIILNGKTGSHFGASHDPRILQDLYTGKIRKCFVEDIADFSRVIDALPNIEWSLVSAINLTLPVVTDNISDRIAVLQFIYNSSKPVIGENATASTLKETIELCSIVSGDEDRLRKKPFFVSSSEPVSPLIQGKDAIEKSLLCAEKGIPNIVYGMQMAGATTPVTFAGCLAIANAEVLSQLVVIQLQNPGAPVIYGGMPSIMDMRTMIYSYGAPEKALMVGALTELCHYYRLPMYGTAGCTDAQIFGIQGSVESTNTILLSLLTGADLVHNIGTIYHGGCRSIEAIVLADEIIDMTKVLIGGVEINDETLALDLIERLGPGGTYLNEKHTLKHFRNLWVPRTFDRSFTKPEGQQDCEQLLKTRTIEILRNHQPNPLPKDIVKELHKVEVNWLKRVGLKEYPKKS